MNFLLRMAKLAAAVALCAATSVLAQTATYPTKSIRMIVPFPPGGPTDVVARLIGFKLSERWGQQVVVDNRAGAAGTIGAEMAARAAPDGHTLVIKTNGDSHHFSAEIGSVPISARTRSACVTMRFTISPAGRISWMRPASWPKESGASSASPALRAARTPASASA